MDNSSSANLSILEELNDEVAHLLSPVTLYMVLVMTTGIVGNGLVCYVHGTKMKKSTASSFILWLAILDLLTCVFAIPLEIYALLRQYTFDNSAMCKIMRFILFLTTMASVVTLIFIAIYRYCKICRPLKTTPIQNCRVVVAVSVTVGVLFSWPNLVLLGRHRIETPYRGIYSVHCNIDDSMIGTIFQQLYLGALGLAFNVAAVILAILYSLIGCHLYKRSRLTIGDNIPASKLEGNDMDERQITIPINSTNKSEGEKEQQHNHKSCDRRYTFRRTGVIFSTITVTFILSFLPSLVLMTTMDVREKYSSMLTDSEYVLFSFGVRTIFINNAINPIIYGVFNDIFRKECIKLWQDCSSRFCFRRMNDKEQAVSGESSSDTAAEGL